jgi:GT2 family glycosyltransferase
MELSVIIVNYNGEKYLKNCLDSLKDKLQGIVYEVIIIDNASTDGSITFIKQYYQSIVLIESKDNLGFGRGNNRAVDHAKGEYLLLLNNDTIIQDKLQPVLQILKGNPGIGAVGIKMLNGNGKYLAAAGNFPYAGNLFRLKNMFHLGKEFKTGIFTKTSYEVDWLTGSFIMLPKKVYVKIGGFDEDYFMYVEDVDFNKKIAERGYKRVFLPNYSYLHFVGYNSSKDNLILNSLDLYIDKHLHGTNRLLAIMSLSFNKGIKCIKKLFK